MSFTILIWLIIFGLIAWLIVWLMRRGARSAPVAPATPPAPTWTMCEKCGGGNYPGVPYCQWCAAELTFPVAATAPPTPMLAGTTPTAYPANAAIPVPSHQFAQVAESPMTSSPTGAPGIGIAGFVLSVLGISLVGIPLSWIGYEQSKREGRPTSLCLAGIIVGFAWLALGFLFFLIVSVYPAL